MVRMSLYQYLRKRHLEDILAVRKILRDMRPTKSTSLVKAFRQRLFHLKRSLANLRKNRKAY